MLERIEDYFFEDPHRIVSAGQWLALPAAGLVVAGTLARMGLAAVDAVGAIATPSARGTTTVDMLVPSWLSWVIPESAAAFAFAIVMCGLGVWVVYQGKQVVRAMGA